ncbi:EAL domain-containing protein [Laspinema sp. D1]|uniref:EAL domain-containing protein n=1 Tax=Laspinema palackyanum TaxID=3231601 RepID=UPI00349A8C2E|nr:EAL domain-containing protein [Laspinema sp. D2b]
MSSMTLLSDLPKLLIQPNDPDTRTCLVNLGFQPVPAVPLLLYRIVTRSQLKEIFWQLSNHLGEIAQSASRFCITQICLDSTHLLLEFLKAQPLISVTNSIKYAWFLRLLLQQKLFFKYQPIFCLKSGQINAYECLARALGDAGQCYSGGMLIEAAIATDLSQEFDELARTTCIESLATLKSDRQFFVNLLPNAIIQNPDSIEQNLQQIIDLGLRPEQIVFELTEVEVLAQSEKLPQLIERMRAWGFRIAVDDLCGCVSVDHYAMELRPDIVKLDRRLIHGCSQFTLKQTLIKSVLDSAHSEGILVLAEGLETIQDIQFCQELGIDFGQGFGLARPEAQLQQQLFERWDLMMSKAS